MRAATQDTPEDAVFLPFAVAPCCAVIRFFRCRAAMPASMMLMPRRSRTRQPYAAYSAAAQRQRQKATLQNAVRAASAFACCCLHDGRRRKRRCANVLPRQVTQTQRQPRRAPESNAPRSRGGEALNRRNISNAERGNRTQRPTRGAIRCEYVARRRRKRMRENAMHNHMPPRTLRRAMPIQVKMPPESQTTTLLCGAINAVYVRRGAADVKPRRRMPSPFMRHAL